MGQVWNGHPAQHTFQVLHSMVWNGGVWNGIRGLDPELWIGMCARPCSGPFILSGSQVYLWGSLEKVFKTKNDGA